jgi:hypothetical protein
MAANKKTKSNNIITRVIFRDKQNKSAAPKLPTSRRLIKETLKLLARYRGLFALLGLSYLIATWLLVAFPASTAYGDSKEILDIALEDGVNNVVGVVTLALGGLSGLFTGPDSQTSQLLSSVITLLFVLGIVFAARHLIARKNDDEDPEVGLRDVLYNSPAPFISSTFVIFIAVLAAIPGALGSALIPYVISLDEPWWSEAVFALVGLALVVLSIFWLVRILFAFFIVTLPGARPWESVKETKEIVAGRRWGILWRLLFPSVLALVAWLLLFIPFLLIDLWLGITWLPLVPVAIGVINALLIITSTVYVYKLYRSLL